MEQSPPEVASDLLAGLNPPQREAVSTLTGPLLVVAGPGSGKTRVLVHRIAALLDSGVLPWEILAVTFTNKAASEMRDRVEALVGSDNMSDMWLSTFHSACVRILRNEHVSVGLPSSFTILDANDTKSVLKKVAVDLDLVLDQSEIKMYANRISYAKNHAEGPTQAVSRYHDERLGVMFEGYAKRLASMNALDFDDLLLHTLHLFQEDPAVLEKYQNRFRHVLVDEYQDTNQVQYELVKLLAVRSHNLCVVGDLDQSVYSWRGSHPQIMADFNTDFPNAKVVVLEQNYRSTKAILALAQAVIDPNPALWRPDLWTENDDGPKPRLYVADDDRDEASFVVDEISATGAALEDHAILVRTNAQTRVLEEELNVRSMPYQVVGALRFYDRAEIKDALAYLRVTLNPFDEVSFARSVNTPKRGVGAKTVDKVIRQARSLDTDLFTAARLAVDQSLVAKKAAAGLQQFLDTIDQVKEAAATGPGKALHACVHTSGLFHAAANSPDGIDRSENLKELLSAADRFEQGGHPTSPQAVKVSSLPGLAATEAFLENVTLVSSEDLSHEGDGRVQILTAHSAKGKEFLHVFVVGLEQNLFPHNRSLDDVEAMAEERRLLFVACSRAEKTLTLTRCASRMLYGGKFQENPPSVFLSGLDDLFTVVASKRSRSRWRHRSQNPARSKYQPKRHVASSPPPRSFSQDTVPLVPTVPRSGPRLSPEDVSPGDRVKHSTFGVGETKTVDAASGTVTVVFDVGPKELLLEFAPLVKIPPSVKEQDV